MNFDSISFQRKYALSNSVASAVSYLIENDRSEAADIIRKREERIERIKKLEEQIRDLQDYLMSESFLLTSDIKRNSSTIFSRFNGYTDFTIGGDVFRLFSECSEEIEKQKNNSKFQFHLENFIWLFFRGQNLIENDNIVEFLQADVSDFGGYGHDPSIVVYRFNVINVDNGRSFRVKFLFYGCCNVNLEEGTYEYLQRSNFGKILVSISEIPVANITMKKNGESAFWKNLEEANCKIVRLSSYDPIEIASFINKIVSEGIDDGN